MLRVRLLSRASAASLLAAILLLNMLPVAARARQVAGDGGQPAPPQRKQFGPLAYRQIGPFRGGRSAAVAGVPNQPFVYYFGATGGGVWKNSDAGANWEPLGDGTFKTGSV